MPGPALNSGAMGISLAERILSIVQSNGQISLDFSQVERMTASFTNALVMTLLEALGGEALIERVSRESAANGVLAEWQRAVERYERGVRLSTQRPGAA